MAEIYDKNKFKCRTNVQQVNTLFKMGEELENWVVYSKEQIDEKLSDVYSKEQIDEKLSAGKIRREFTSLSDFTTYLSSAYLNVGDTLHVCCIGSYQALDFDVVINSRQTDISDTDPDYIIPCSGVATYTHLSGHNLTKTTHIVYEAEVGAFNNIMYMTYTSNGNTISYTGVGTSDIIGADVVYFMAVLITKEEV